MRFLEAQVGVFGALRDVTVSFGPGVNLVIGENEAGKSTLFAAIRHTLLTASRQPPAQRARILGRYFPRPEGTVLHARMRVEADGNYAVAKRWGDDHATQLILPDGAEMAGPAAEECLAGLLPVRTGTYDSLFLVDQAQLQRTLSRVRDDQSSREEVASLLRRSRSETGGVSVEAFQRKLADRIKAMFSRWDRERDRPEGGRGLENPWKREVGTLLAAYYRLLEARSEADRVRAWEAELEAQTTILEERAAALQEADAFLDLHRDAYEALRTRVQLEREIATEEERLEHVRAAVRRWPVVEEELARQQAERERAEADAERAEQALAAAREKRRRHELRRQFEQAAQAQAEVEEARARRDAIPESDPEALARLRELEQRAATLHAKLHVGTLRVRLSTPPGEGERTGEIRIQPDAESPRDLTVAPGSPEELEAHRRILLEHAGLTVEVQSGEEPYEELLAQFSAVEERRESLNSQLGVSTAEEAAGQAGARAHAQRELDGAQRRLAQVLGERTFEELAGDAGMASGQEPPEPLAGAVSEEQLARELSQATERLGAATSSVRSLETEQRQLTERYGSQDELEDVLATTRSRLTHLAEQRAAAPPVPDGFTSADEFLATYERYQQEAPELRRLHGEARVEQATLLGDAPERTGEEAQADVESAEHELAQVRRKADALSRLETVTRSVIAEQKTDPFAPFAQAVTDYLSVISEDTYRATEAADPLAPERYARSDGPELDYELLSLGTRDMVALAIRLALAETALSGEPAPLLLDDPLVDMDPRRRERAAAAITRYAARDPERQVILFTCHPDHAALFPDAHRMELSR